jgi:hypothetical protein
MNGHDYRVLLRDEIKKQLPSGFRDERQRFKEADNLAYDFMMEYPNNSSGDPKSDAEFWIKESYAQR